MHIFESFTFGKNWVNIENISGEQVRGVIVPLLYDVPFTITPDNLNWEVDDSFSVVASSDL